MIKAIVVQGAPGVGKTTLARRLANDLSFRLIAKDDIKESLYDKLGYPKDRTESELYGRMSIRAMYAGLDEFIKAGQPVIIDAPLLPEFAVSDLSSITSLDDLLQLHVSCDPAVHERRFKERVASGERHGGHADTVVDAAAVQAKHSKIPGIDTIEVDTTDFADSEYESLLEIVRKKIQEGRA